MGGDRETVRGQGVTPCTWKPARKGLRGRFGGQGVRPKITPCTKWGGVPGMIGHLTKGVGVKVPMGDCLLEAGEEKV